MLAPAVSKSKKPTIYDVNVYVKNEFQVYKVMQFECFAHLKQRILRSLGKVVKRGDELFYRIVLHFFSVISKIKPAYMPFERDPVVDVLLREEYAFPGRVILKLIDLRKSVPADIFKFDDSGGLQDDGSSYYNGSLICTEWIPNLQLVSLAEQLQPLHPCLSLSDSMFWEISNLAVAQGRLLRKVVINRRQEAYREEYVILEWDRLWYFNVAPKSGDRDLSPPSFRSLRSNTVSTAQLLDQTTFSVTMINSVGEKEILTFRTQSTGSAEHWVKSFYRVSTFERKAKHRLSEASDNGQMITVHAAHAAEPLNFDYCTDNDMINLIEDNIAELQDDISMNDIEAFQELSTLEGTLKNRYLRGYFQKFLSNNTVEESLLFWEHVEDYRRGHPQSEVPFQFTTELRVVESAAAVKNWAESIYKAFVEEGAPYQICFCTQQEREQVHFGIYESSAQEFVSAGVFHELQLNAYVQLKYNFFPQFLQVVNYRRVMIAALHAAERSLSRLNLMSTFVKSEVEPPTARGLLLVNGTVSGTIIKKPETPAASRFPMFGGLSRMLRRRGSKEESVAEVRKSQKRKPTADALEGYQYSTPWRRRQLGIYDSGSGSKGLKIYWLPEWWWEFVDMDEIESHEHYQRTFRKRSSSVLQLPARKLSASNMDRCVLVPVKSGAAEVSLSEFATLVPIWLPTTMHSSTPELQYQHHCESLDMELLMLQQKEELSSILHESERMLIDCTSISALESITAADKKGSVRSSNPSHPAPAHGSAKKHKEANSIIAYKLEILHEDFAPYQPNNFLHANILGNLGTVVLSGIIRCRYFRRKINQKNIKMLSAKSGYGGFRSSPSSTSLSTPSTPTPAEPDYSLSMSVAHRHLLKELVLDTSAAKDDSSASSRRMRSMSDEYIGLGAGVDWLRQYAMVSVCLGASRINLFDMFSHSHIANINLACVTRIAPTPSQFHSMDVYDSFGLNWQLMPEGIDEEDTRNATKAWLDTLAAVCLPSTEVVYMLKSGYLSKRGKYNKAFKLRWFVLTSDAKLRYYKDDQSGAYKGEIDLINIERVSNSIEGSLVRFDKEIRMKMVNREWVLLAEDAVSAEEWKAVLKQLMTSPYFHKLQQNKGLSSGKDVDDDDDD